MYFFLNQLRRHMITEYNILFGKKHCIAFFLLQHIELNKQDQVLNILM